MASDEIKNVVLIGATGNLGPAILAALQASPLNVTVLTRSTSTSAKPPGVNVKAVDFTSHAELVSAFKGADAVVSIVASEAVRNQTTLIDAAIEAGVKRFLPSEFGSDTSNETTGKLEVFAGKVVIRKYLEEKAKEGKIEYTLVSCGPFLDWGLKVGFMSFNTATKSATLYDNGANHFSTSILSDVGKAVVGILTHPAATKNKTIYVFSATISQLDLLRVYEKLTGGQKWTTTNVSTVEFEKEGLEKVRKGDYSGYVNQILRGIMGEGFGSDFRGRESNELLGIKVLDGQGLEDIVKDSLEAAPAS